MINFAKAGVGVTAVDLPGDAAHIAEGAQI
jgi:hypothetical protein